MPATSLQLDFYHDAVCGWCFVMSPRLRQLADELPIVITHRTFVLQDSPEQMIARFGSIKDAKSVILEHWEQCALHDDNDRINIEGMRRQIFDYPTGIAAALACKAVELQGGQSMHWDYFDAVQHAHLSENRNIGDEAVLLDIATNIGVDTDRYRTDLSSEKVKQLVASDRKRAQMAGVRAVPTLIVQPGDLWLHGAPLDQLRDSLKAHLRRIDPDHLSAAQ